MSGNGIPSDWHDSLRLKLEALIDEFVVDGVARDEVFAAVVAETAALKESFDRDPDPAEEFANKDVVEEPANDWPSAE